MSHRLPPLLASALAAVLASAAVAHAAPTDPAASQIERFDAALLSAMHGGASLGVHGRARTLTPAVEQAFDIPVMTRFSVGPAWAGMSDSDHTALIDSFRRLIVANYAHNFDSDSAKFEVQPTVETRGLDKLVQCHIVPNHGDVANVVYRMRDDGGWKVIDVFYNGSISELTTKRSDFAATVSSGGAKALVAHIDAQADKLMR